MPPLGGSWGSVEAFSVFPVMGVVLAFTAGSRKAGHTAMGAGLPKVGLHHTFSGF